MRKFIVLALMILGVKVWGVEISPNQTNPTYNNLTVQTLITGLNLSISSMVVTGTGNVAANAPFTIGNAALYYSVYAGNSLNIHVPGVGANDLAIGYSGSGAVGGGYWDANKLYGLVPNNADNATHIFTNGTSRFNIDINGNATFAAGLAPGSYAAVVLQESTPTATGLMYYDTTNKAVIVSTGTTQRRQFGMIYSGTTKPTGW